MYGFFLNCSQSDFAADIFRRYKIFETRTRNTLKRLESCKDVAIIVTGLGDPKIVGFADFGFCSFIEDRDTVSFDYAMTMSCIPENSTFYYSRGTKNGENGKYFYRIEAARKLKNPIAFSDCKNITRHGRSWCEFEL